MAKVLLIEPDKVLADTYTQAFARIGLRVQWEPAAQTAINHMDKKPAQVVVLEMQLAEHNGVEFLYELRSHADWQHIPVIILSVVPEHELGLSDELKDKLGVVAYYYKPQTSLQELVSVVRDVIAHKP